MLSIAAAKDNKRENGSAAAVTITISDRTALNLKEKKKNERTAAPSQKDQAISELKSGVSVGVRQ